jgi:hypothetical protein
MIFTPEEWVEMATATAELSNLQYRAFGSLGRVLDSFEAIEDVCPGIQYRCHICGIPWGH